MRDNKKVFILIESILAMMLALLVVHMFWEKNGEGRYRVSVVVQDSDSSQWSAFQYGLRMAAEDLDIELTIVSTGVTLTQEEEKELIEAEIDNGARAIIVQPVPGAEEMLKKMEKKVPVMLAESAASQEGEPYSLPVTGPDNYKLGAALAEGLLEDFGGNLEGKVVGVLSGDTGSEASASRSRGLREALEKAGAEIRWPVFGSFTENGENSLRALDGVDVVAALDDGSLVAAGKYSAANDLHGALVYGIGNSTEAAYYLDTDAIRCLVVPDGFQMGYQSLTELAKSLDGYFYQAKSQIVPFTSLRRETLFLKENQDILFTMSQ